MLVRTAGGEARANVYSGSDLLLQDGELDVETTRSIQYPWDYNLSDVAAAGERLGVQITNTTSAGGPHDVEVSVRITPL